MNQENLEATGELTEIQNETREKHAGGRPSKYNPDKYIPKLLEMMKEGATIEEYCAEVEISKETFYQWIKKYPELSDAKKRGLHMAYAWWLKQGRINLENKSFSFVGFYMQMKNRFGWRDKQEIEHKNTDQGAVFDVAQLKPDELVTLSNMLKRIEKQEKPAE